VSAAVEWVLFGSYAASTFAGAWVGCALTTRGWPVLPAVFVAATTALGGPVTAAYLFLRGGWDAYRLWRPRGPELPKARAL
jgi:hypothetical protein